MVLSEGVSRDGRHGKSDIEGIGVISVRDDFDDKEKETMFSISGDRLLRGQGKAAPAAV